MTIDEIVKPTQPTPTATPVRKPYVSAIVLYAGGKDSVSKEKLPSKAAIVTAVNAKNVNLQVFGTLSIYARANIPYDPYGAYETWHWLEDEETT